MNKFYKYLLITLLSTLVFTGCTEEQTSTFIEDNKTEEVTKTYKNVDESTLTSIELINKFNQVGFFFNVGEKVTVKLKSFASKADLKDGVINTVDKELIISSAQNIDKLFKNSKSQELSKIDLKMIADELHYLGRMGLENISDDSKEFYGEFRIPTSLNKQYGAGFYDGGYVTEGNFSGKDFKIIAFDEVNGKMKNIQVSGAFSLKSESNTAKLDIKEFKTGLDGKDHAVLNSNYGELYKALKPYINGLDSSKYDTSVLANLDEETDTLYCKNGGHVSTTFRFKQYTNLIQSLDYTPEIHFNVGTDASANWVKGLIPLDADETDETKRATSYEYEDINLDNNNEILRTISACIPKDSLKPLFDKYMANLNSGKVTVKIPTKLKLLTRKVYSPKSPNYQYEVFESSVKDLEIIFTVPTGFNRKAYVNKTPVEQVNKDKKAISRAINRSGTLDSGVSSKNLGIDFAGIKFDTTFDTSFVDTETTQKTTLNLVSGIYGHFGGSTIPFFKKTYKIENHPNDASKNEFNVDTFSPLGALFYSGGLGAFASANSAVNSALAQTVVNTMESVSAKDRFFFEISKTLVGLGKGDASLNIGIASGFEITLLEGIQYQENDVAGNSQDITYKRVNFTHETAASSGNYEAYKDAKKTIDKAKEALNAAKESFKKGLGAGAISLLGLPIEFTAGMTIELGSGFAAENSLDKVNLTGQLVYISAGGWGRGGLGLDLGVLAAFAGVRGDVNIITLDYGHNAQINFDMEEDKHFRYIKTYGKVAFNVKVLKGSMSAIAELTLRLLFFSVTLGANYTFLETPYLYAGEVVFFESENYYLFNKGSNDWRKADDNLVMNWMNITRNKEVGENDFEYVYSNNGKYKLALDSNGNFYVKRVGDNSTVGNIIAAGASDVTNGLVINKTFDESNAYIDSVSNRYTISGGVGLTTGKKGNAGNFSNTNAYYSLESFPSSFPNTQYGNSHTISAWIKTTRSDTDQGIVGWGQRGTVNKGSLLQLRGSDIMSEWWGNDQQNRVDNLVNNWHHVAMTYDTVTQQRAIYVDGIQKSIRTLSSEISALLQKFTIGANVDKGYGFHGLIDEVRVYNRSLSSQEIKRVYYSAFEVTKVRFNQGNRVIELIDKDGLKSEPFCGVNNPITTNYVLALRDDGRLQIYAGTEDKDLKLMECESNTQDTSSNSYVDKLYPGEQINANRKIVSSNGIFELKQYNGKVVIYQNDINAPVWTYNNATLDFRYLTSSSTDTNGSINQLVVNINNPNHSDYFGNKNYYIQLDNNGKLIMYQGNSMDSKPDTVYLTYFDGVVKDFVGLNNYYSQGWYDKFNLPIGTTIFSKSKEYFLQVENEGNLKVYRSMEKNGDLSSDRVLLKDDGISVSNFEYVSFKDKKFYKKASFAYDNKDISEDLNMATGYKSLEMGDDGVFRVYSNVDNMTYYYSGLPMAKPTNRTVIYQLSNLEKKCSSTNSKYTLYSGERLNKGESLCSSNGRYELKLDTYGRLSLYDHTEEQEIWRPLSNNRNNDYVLALGTSLFLSTNSLNYKSFTSYSNFKNSDKISWQIDLEDSSIDKAGYARYRIVLDDKGSLKLYNDESLSSEYVYTKTNEHKAIFASIVNVDGSFLNLNRRYLEKGEKFISDNNRYELINDFIEGIVVYDRKTDSVIAKNIFSSFNQASFIDSEGKFDIVSFIDTVYTQRGLVKPTTAFSDFYNIILDIDNNGKLSLFNKETYDSTVDRIWTNGSDTADIYDTYLALNFDGALSDSRNNVTATAIGHPEFTKSIQGKAISFDGVDDYIQFSDLTIPKNYSISVWVKNSDRVGSFKRVFDFGNGDGDNNLLLTYINSCSQIGLHQYDGVNPVFNKTIDIACDTWNHIVISQSEDRLKIYLNNKLVLDESNSFEKRTLTKNFLGKSNWGNPLVKLEIDDFMIFNKALSANQVDDIYKKAPKSVFNFDDDVNDKLGKANGTLSGNASFVTGIRGKALEFDGKDDFVTLPEMTFGKEYTISSWVYNTANLNWDRIVDFGNGQNVDNIVLAYHRGCSNVSLYDHNLGRFVVASGLDCNQWNHIVASVDKTGKGKIYVNGKLKGTNQGNIRKDSKTLTKNFIGKSNWTNQPLAKAKMDDIKIYDRVLSDDEIQADFLSYKTFKSCKELLDAGVALSGKYTINPTGNEDIEVYCDMVTDGGGWTSFASSNGKYKWFGGQTAIPFATLRDDYVKKDLEFTWADLSYSYGTYDPNGGVSNYWRDYSKDKSPKEVLFKTGDGVYWMSTDLSEIKQSLYTKFQEIKINNSSNNFGSCENTGRGMIRYYRDNTYTTDNYNHAQIYPLYYSECNHYRAFKMWDEYNSNSDSSRIYNNNGMIAFVRE